MAGAVIDNKGSLDKVLDCINGKRSFLLEAGAGSGKTWCLIESLKYILEKQSETLLINNQQVVCITYTNVAKDEISERINQNPLVLVRTIHEFLWDVIRNYQKELKSVILVYNNENPKNCIEDLETLMKEASIEYTQYGRKFEDGRITHDDVLEFSSRLFRDYPKIRRIVSDKYPYILVDEYQDTEKRTVELLVDNLLDGEKQNIVIGFFGDSMQKIYNQGIGVIKSEKLENVTREDNFRCSVKVIDLLNKIRPSLVQKPSGNNLKGEVSFLYCSDASDVDNYTKAINYLTANGWTFDPKKTKVLMLTHRGIADKLHYLDILNLYQRRYSFGREMLYEKEEMFSDLFFNKIEKLVALYKEKRYGEFIELLGKEGFQLIRHEHKKGIKEQMDALDVLRTTGTTNEVFDYVFDKELLTKPQKIKDLEKEINGKEIDEDGLKKKTFFDDLMKISYREITALNEFIEDQTPFSTKHGVKGAEYENVLVVINDAAWNQYSFNDVFCNNQKKLDRYNRTRNLLYVCCSRAKDKLALLSLSNMDQAAMGTINNWFGKENVYDVNALMST